MKRHCILTNANLRQLRTDRVYQALVIDLMLYGYIEQDDAESLLGYKIPDYVKGPDGQSLGDINAQTKIKKLADAINKAAKAEGSKKADTSKKAESTGSSEE